MLIKKDKFGIVRFELLRWVLRARAKEDSTRYAVANILVEPECIVATDGRRLHKAILAHDIPPGQYTVEAASQKRIVLALGDEPGKWPKYEDMFLNDKAVELDTGFTFARAKDRFFGEFYRAFFAQWPDGGLAFDIRFLQDAYINEDYRYTMLFSDDREGPIQINLDIESRDRKYHAESLVMPFSF